MRHKSRFALGVLVSLTLGLSFCGQYINNPAPRTTSLDPASILAGSPQFTLTINGSGFSPVSVVEWNGAVVVTIFLSQTQLQATIPAALVQNPGAASVVVFTPAPGGGTSNPALQFQITPNVTPIPQITSISPTTVAAGANGIVVTVTGMNFVTTSEATVNGTTCSIASTCIITPVNSTTVLVSIQAPMLTTGGMLPIVVVNPPAPPPAPPNGGSSNAVDLTVLNPLPAITTVSPAAAQAGGTASVTLTVTGTSFVSSSVIEINGGARLTSFVNSTTLTTLLATADLTAAGIDQVQVFSPTPGGGISNILTFAVNPTKSAGLPVLVDFGLDGAPANLGICGTTCANGTPTQSNAGPSASMTGEFIAFASDSTNLVANDTNGASDIFFRNTCLGVGGVCVPFTNLVTTDPNGNAANGASFEPSLDGSGTHAAFTSLATNLVTTVPIPAGTSQVYWRPVCQTATGCAPTDNPVQLVSISADGASAGNGPSFNAAISPEGRFVAFVSLATNLVSNVAFDGVTPQVFVRDTCSGATSGTTCSPTTFLISTPDGTTPANAASSSPSVASGSLEVSFTSSATNLGAPAGVPEIFMRTCTFSASVCTGTTTLASTLDGSTAADAASVESSITSDGRFVAFASLATNLGTNPGGVQQIYVRDTCTGQATCTPSTTLVSTGDGFTPGNAISERPSINQTGQMIAFASLASNLGAVTANGIENIFVRNTCATVTSGCTAATALASQPAGVSPPQANGASLAPSISGDGHVVSFLSFANNLVARDTNGFSDIFIGTTTF